MTTAAERLKRLSGLAGVTAATMLLAIGSGATAGAALVNYSGLHTGTAAEHLLAERTSQVVIRPEAGGHWKQLFKPAYGVTAPAVIAKCSLTYRILPPAVSSVSIVGESVSVTWRGTVKCTVLAPSTGVITVQVGEECGAAFRVVEPKCHANTPYIVRGKCGASWGLQSPTTGCIVFGGVGYIVSYGVVFSPKVVQNPSYEMLLAVL